MKKLQDKQNVQNVVAIIRQMQNCVIAVDLNYLQLALNVEIQIQLVQSFVVSVDQSLVDSLGREYFL